MIFTTEQLAWINVGCFVIMTGGLVYLMRVEKQIDRISGERDDKLRQHQHEGAGSEQTEREEGRIYREYAPKLRDWERKRHNILDAFTLTKKR